MATQSLRVLLNGLIDYAGLFPPAGLALPDVAERYESYAKSPDSWILNRLVLPAAHLTALRPRWRVTLLVDADPGPLPRAVETIETRLPQRFSLPTYCEVPLSAVPAGAFAKLRTGGLTPDAIPSPEFLADFLLQAAAMHVPFKATAGLHHPVRSEHPLSYDASSPRAVMHGFLNVFLAAAFAWHGAAREQVLDVLNETDPHSFQFLNHEVFWRGRRLTNADIASARRDFGHSFGSCSFEEPIADLRQLELLT